MALISLVATPAAITAAEKMDAKFWLSTSRMESLGEFDEASWSEILQDLRSVRLDFINIAREEIVGVGHGLDVCQSYCRLWDSVRIRLVRRLPEMMLTRDHRRWFA